MSDLLLTEKFRQIEEIVTPKTLSRLDDKVIKVKVPASVAFDLKKMNKVTAEVLGRLGCPGCHSGYDLRFDFERQFVFNEKLEITHGL